MTESYVAYKSRVEKLTEELIQTRTEFHYREFVRYALQGGKRIRSVIALALLDRQLALMDKPLDAKARSAAEMTCLVTEILHSASLIVDDLPCMDDAKTRRGRPCMHIKFDEAVAILTASHLLTTAARLYTWAYKELRHAGVGCAENTMVLLDDLAACMSFEGASGGQMMDLKKVPFKHDRETLDKLMRLKTASFFQIGIVGAVLVCRQKEVTEEDMQKLVALSNLTGIAFQTFDDFEDVLEDEEGSHNSVLSSGVHASYLNFLKTVREALEILQHLQLDNQAYKDVMTMMQLSIEKRMNDANGTLSL